MGGFLFHWILLKNGYYYGLVIFVEGEVWLSDKAALCF